MCWALFVIRHQLFGCVSSKAIAILPVPATPPPLSVCVEMAADSDNDSEAPPPNGLSMPWLDGGRGKGGGRGGRGRGGASSVAGEDAAAVSMEVTRGPLLASEITKLLRTQDDDASEIAGSTAASLRGGKRKRRGKDKKRARDDSDSESGADGDGDGDGDLPPQGGCTKLVAATAFGGGDDDGSAISSSDDDDDEKRCKSEKTFKCVGCLADRKYVALVDTVVASNACAMEASALFQSASKLWQAKVVERAAVDGVRVQRWPWKQLREHYLLHKVDQNLSRVANITAMTKARALLESQLVVTADGGDKQLDIKRFDTFLKLVQTISKETSLLGASASASSMPPPLTKK